MFTDAAEVVIGASFSCVRTTTGAVACAGLNDRGQIGVPVNNPPGSIAVPTAIALDRRATALIAGGAFACAADDQARVWCWGADDNDQLAPSSAGQFGDQPFPILSRYRSIASMAAGNAHVCVRTADNGLQCGGFNGRGQLGDGQHTTRVQPALVPGLTGVTSIVGNFSNMCAVHGDHTVSCWGYNSAGQLGDGTFNGQPTPHLVDSLAGVSQVVLGSNHACALLQSGGDVVCWGDNRHGQLGDTTILLHGLPHPVIDMPVPIPLTGATRLAAADSHTCALGPNFVKCWGSSDQGQSGTAAEVHSASFVGLPTGMLDLAVGPQHSCAIAPDHTVMCWGYDGSGQLGNVPPSSDHTPTPVIAKNLSNIDQLSANGAFTCGHVSTDGSVMCWGTNGNGELGNGAMGTTTTMSVPTPVAGLSGTLAVATGSNHACAIKPGGSVVCWGANTRGQLGDGGYIGHNAFVAVPGLTGVTAIAGSGAATCAVLGDGTVSCWGNDRDGELGDGIAATHAPVVPALPCP
jgi:alpha-tubulin suppressor-like RCC1 family protein